MEHQNDDDSLRNESSTGVSIPNGHALKDDKDISSNDGDDDDIERAMNFVQSNRFNDAPSIVIQAPSSPTVERNPRSVDHRDDLMNQKLDGLENRVCRIEKQILQFKNTFDLQMRTILDMMRDLKEELDGKEIVEKIDSCRSNFEIEPEVSTADTMTSSF